MGRKVSAPAFGDLRERAAAQQQEQQRLSRTNEFENIPEVMEERRSLSPRSPKHSPPKRHQGGIVRQSSQRSDMSEELPPPPPSPPPLSSPSPPPPPPPFEDDDIDHLPPPLEESPPQRMGYVMGSMVINGETTGVINNDRLGDLQEHKRVPDDIDYDNLGDATTTTAIINDARVTVPDEQTLPEQYDNDTRSQHLHHPGHLQHEHSPHNDIGHTATATATVIYDVPPDVDDDADVREAATENCLEPPTSLPQPDDSFSREDSLDVAAPHDSSREQGDISLAELSIRADTSASGSEMPETNGGVAHPPRDQEDSVSTPAMMRAISEASNASGHEDEHRRRGRHRPTDTAYYIAKELLMTERTYKKDLELLCVWFRNAVSSDPTIHASVHEVLFQYLDPIYNFHYAFLKEVEQRLAAWEGKAQPQTNGECQKIGDLMLKAINNLQEIYETYLVHLEETLTEFEIKVKRQRPFEELCRGFEAQKVCYLPLNTFLLRPAQRLMHLKLILERLVKHYCFTHHDTEDCKEALCRITEIINGIIDNFKKVENLEKLMELQRDLLGLESLVHPDREFVREGCLQKFSRKGYQQRMFFLFSDMLVYTSRTSASLLQFKVHGQLPLKGMTVEETDQSKSSVQNSFAIYAGNKYILVAACSPEEKDKWMEDITDAVQKAKQQGSDKLQYPSLKSSASSSENVGGSGENVDTEGEKEKPIQHRANTTMHVCWHRNTSVSMRDHDKALKNQLSGYLLRKFKTSNGWQKLWVVFTNFCLFFYKTYQDDVPLASLPLLGYAVSVPAEDDGISKEHVFKLQFKNHVYFFRAESQYTFSRWMEVINSATHNARRTRLFSRLDSRLEAS